MTKYTGAELADLTHSIAAVAQPDSTSGQLDVALQCANVEFGANGPLPFRVGSVIRV